MFLIALANELFLCSGKVVGEATPGVPRLPLSHHQNGGWSWEARELLRQHNWDCKRCLLPRKSSASSTYGAFGSLSVVWSRAPGAGGSLTGLEVDLHCLLTV